jgi:Protein of unknown function (DUF1997)
MLVESLTNVAITFMQVKFVAHQSLDLTVAEHDVPITHYLRQPQRLVKALVDPSQIESMSDKLFCLKMRPINFLHFTLQPTVEMQVWAESDGTLKIQSQGCEIRGIDYINQRFHLDLVGKLVPTSHGKQAQLNGRADLTVQVDLPPALWFTPKPILEAAGNSLLKSVLMTVKQRLSHQLLVDYSQWAQSQAAVDNIAEGARQSSAQKTV